MVRNSSEIFAKVLIGQIAFPYVVGFTSPRLLIGVHIGEEDPMEDSAICCKDFKEMDIQHGQRM